jgi:FkbM family methyltransferase
LRIAPLLPALPPLKIVDVGAMFIGEGTDAYTALANACPCEVIGFEPVKAECERLIAMNIPGRTYLPYFVGDGTARKFYECNAPMTSSLFEPNAPLLAKFQTLEGVTRIVNVSTVETRRLDDIPETAGADFLKLDVQGGELLVLMGAEARLKNVLVIHTEVEFVPLYKDQPLFADIDGFLRARGFAFHKMNGLAGRTFKPLMANNQPSAALSQNLWGDAVYVRDFMAFDALAPEALLKIATICHENYKSYDLVGVALEAYDRKMGTGLQMDYLRTLTEALKAPAPTEP